jgi:hypothetical protein
VQKKGLRKQLAKAQSSGSGDCLVGIDRYRLACERLLTVGKLAANEPSVLQLKEKIAHLHARARMSERHLQRLSIVIKELLRLHYHRYSNGWKSVAKDIFLS